jgi:ribonuclease BN (tRNA processing enzyme)
LISLRLLGCNGGIGGKDRQTTSYLLQESTIIDAGTGLTILDLPELAAIDHVVLTHAHMDHIACLPLLIDSVTAQRESPVQVWTLPEVIDILSTHIFNEKVWPDFRKIPSPDSPFMTLNAISQRTAIGGMFFTPLPARHGIPACGYLVENEGVALAFSGDTEDCPSFWEAMKQSSTLKAVVVECSYPSALTNIAQVSMHMDVPSIVARVAELPKEITVVIVHRKPGLEDAIEAELRMQLPSRDLIFPKPGDVLSFG